MQLHLLICPPLFTSWAICILATFVFILLLGNNATMQGTPCDKTRQVFNSSWGVITDGPPGSNYTQDSHCEWLIKAKNNEQFITLRFQTMGTECSYDYVFVYDGDSFGSRLLGTFSGKTEPQQVTAKSGAMLILLYSDTNYVLGGFQSEFSVTDCPQNCTYHGTCVGHTCVCEENWGGRDCSLELCPENCNSNWGKGICQQGQCHCSPGYSGQSCSLNVGDTIGNSWHWLSHSQHGLAPRAAHTAVYIKESDSLYVFGGYNLNAVLEDLAVYRFGSSTWEDKDGNALGALLSTNQLDAETLAGALRQVNISDEQWGLKPRTFLRNILYSFADNSSFGHSVLRQNQVRTEREAEIEEDTVTNQNIPIGNSEKELLEKPKELTPETTTTEYFYRNDSVLPAELTTLNPEPRTSPSARYGHGACRYPGGFVIYGGKLSDGGLSDELWLYNVSSRKWSLRALSSEFRPPKLTRHTVTLVGNNTIYLFGGSTMGGEFSSKLFAIILHPDDASKEQWEQIQPRGGKELDVRVVAHTTVYHARSHSLLVYGGVMAGFARFSKLSDRMFLFNLRSRHWAEINYPRAHLPDTYVPRERAFHSSTILGNYLIVFGGYSHRHNKEEICYDNQMYLYHLSCHTWVSHDILGLADKGSRYRKHQGVFAHAADVRNGNTLLIVGGYHGNVNSDLWAYVLPPMLATREGEILEPEQVCSRHHSLLECTSNPECGWCSADEVCYGRTVGVNCTTNLQTRRCPGVCPSLGDCHSCLIHGEMPTARPALSVAHKLRLGQCTWCVQNARCHHKDDNYGVCGLREDTPSQAPGWWGSQGTEVTHVEECRIKDRRPGLTFVKYKHPANWSQPDSVSIINATTVDFDISVKDTRTENSIGGGLMIARLVGSLRVPDSWVNLTETLKMCTSFSSTVLRLSSSGSQSSLEVVGNLSTDSSDCAPAKWLSGRPVVLLPGTYLVDFESKKSVTSGSYLYQQSKMALKHEKNQENTAKTFTFEFLEPYQNGSCHFYSNCLHCLTDSLCGWCDLNNKCLPRSLNESQFCRSEGTEDWHYLTLQPFSCANCSNYISCELCVSSNLCEWWVEDARCSRRGRAPLAVLDLSECPVPCHLRRNCSQCLDDKGRCVWCEATQECFSFSVYTSEYQFGLCREWIDQSYYTGYQSGVTTYGRSSSNRGSEQCKSCSKHSNCSSCLHTLSCGWCYIKDEPIKGICVAGDFNRPQIKSCTHVINAVYNTSLLTNQTGWSYAQCPDVNECDLKLDNCHPQAICTNTDGSYTCECKRGFYGDGRLSCTKTCYNKCINGLCTMAPDYRCECNLGWTGEDCSIDCGCHNHSSCNRGPGLCDQCHDWTFGEFCHLCKDGSYGNATTAERCKPCDCNGHGDASKRLCDTQTGVCFCQHNTVGDRCERCKKGFYGDPSDGGICYYQCMSRGMVTGSESQGIGSRRASMTPWEFRLEGTLPRECLWILKPPQVDNVTSIESVIQLNIDKDISVKCQDNSVFVYDGLPDLVTSPSSHQTHALATFCQRDDESPLMVETKSGVLTILYKQGDGSEGFNASYNIFTCPDNCPANRTCVGDACVCLEGWTGPNCSLSLCPLNCSFHLKQGQCDKGYGRCLCRDEFGGPDCSVKVSSNQLIFTELFNSARLSDGFDHLRKMIPRFGHSLVADRRGSLWMLGGYSLSHGPLNDIRLFDTKNNTWMQVTVDSTRDAAMPQGRYLHAAEIVHSKHEIFVYGGIAAKETSFFSLGNSTLQDFWKFSIKQQRWIEVEIKTANTPPPLAGHTLTLVKDEESKQLLLIGGFSPLHGFLDIIWQFDLEKGIWDTFNTLGTGPVGVYGHTTVYHGETKSLYLFGGYMSSANRTIYSNKLYAFHYPTLTWSQLPTFEEYNPMSSNLPQPRFLHSAISTKDYMLVFGGRLSRGERFLTDSPDSLIAYSYMCNIWIRLLSRGPHVVGSPPPLTYGQAMTRDPETGAVYIVGGFDNVIQSHVTRVNLSSDLCNLWGGKDKCRSFLGCSYCSVAKPDKTLSASCYASYKSLKDHCDYHNGTLITNNGVICDGKWFQQRNCEQFRTCSECLAKWPVYLDEQPICKWCEGCGRNRCVGWNKTCGLESFCHNITEVEECEELSCAASDCEKCNRLESCVWSGQSCVKQDSDAPLPASCPPRCSEHKDCISCLSSQCRWSTALKECIPPDYQPLYCAGGACGLVLKEGKTEFCPEPCSSYTQCSSCLKNTHCGWCAIDSENSTGQGVCMEGSLDKPLLGPDHDTCEGSLYNESVSWHYVTCPAENECANDHHSCNKVSEECMDLEDGFQCVCGSGYKSVHSQCEPVCSQGCVRGVCVEPNVCLCDFGYVGANCSIQCQCNGHSDCEGPDKLDVCLGCQNNTKGAQCEKCKALFVGDPTNNGRCVPCFDFCNKHTEICINDSLSTSMFLNKSVEELSMLLEEGPASNALCVGCTNNTKGRRCNECMEGHFRGTLDLTDQCRPCECHGHGDRCDPVTGEKCNCANNTESECQTSVSKNSNQQCWKLQCSKCKDSYSGTPTEGHQCYKQMTLDHKFCLDSKLIDECKVKPKPLYPGQSVFFQVQPRYVNVDIRVILDVTQGSLDLYMSQKDDSLVVTTNSSSGRHELTWDAKYDKIPKWGHNYHSNTVDFPRSADTGSEGNRSSTEYCPESCCMLEVMAGGLTTYVTVHRRNTFLVVRNIRDRLILTLPKDKYDLVSTRFYLALTASSGDEASGPSYGILFFRQDQLHIDLFVFFSVFFSCFFLFLAGCVVAWKAKQASDMRRARRRHVVEMLHMAKRPFAGVILHLDHDDSEDCPNLFSQSPHRKKRNKQNPCGGELRPVAIEPTDDGVAAIATVFVRLPGGSDAPVRLSLASSLVMMSRVYPLNSRAFLRRRSSHHGLS